MIELKLFQGAKPGHSGILPALKVSPEIAAARGISVGQACVSPAWHSAFSTPIGLLEFVAQLRELSGGRPVGFKLCIGAPREFLCICKAMRETGITPDFITVDGAEGGTGAAPLEFSDRLGMPIRDGLSFVHNALVGIDMRDRLRIAASGKMFSAFRMAMALGADWCNSARGFMFSLGCIQAQKFHTNKCPIGIATQDPKISRALVPEAKWDRVHHFHHNTVEALSEFTAAAGLDHPSEFEPQYLWERTSTTQVRSLDEAYVFLEPGQLLSGDVPPLLKRQWDEAHTDSYACS